MLKISVLLSVCIALVGFTGIAEAAYGSACYSDSDCLAADNTLCDIPGPCQKGTCSNCKAGYTVSGGACKKDYGQSCALAADCATGTCTASVCACAASDTWSSTYQACYTTGGGWGDACVTDASCHVVSGADGACTNSLCDCADGFYKDTGYVCRAGYLGEACTVAGGCIVRGVVGVTTEQAPTCQSLVCACDSASSHVAFSIYGSSYCTNTAVPATKLVEYETCADHIECASGYCFNCQGSGGAQCVASGSIKVNAALGMTVSLIVGVMLLL